MFLAQIIVIKKVSRMQTVYKQQHCKRAQKLTKILKMVIREVSLVSTLVAFIINLSYLVYNEIAFKEVSTIKYSVKNFKIIYYIIL